MKKIQPTNRKNDCPVCGDASGKCRTTDTELVLCMNTLDKNSLAIDWTFLGLTKGGGQWGKIVPAGQPESGNASALRQQRAAERSAVEDARFARMKTAKQRHKDYLYKTANCPILEADRADLIRRGLKDEDIAELTPINDGRGGYIIPIRDKDGLMVGGQRRLTVATRGGRYRWATDGENQLPETRELPLAHWQGSDLVESIALVEGTGVKPYRAAKRLNALTIGAAGGNFVSSPKTLKATLDQYSDLPVVLVPDAGAVTNKSVIRQYANVQALLKKWGRELQVIWWGQESKADGDVDEISADLFTATILWDEFAAIANRLLGNEFIAIPTAEDSNAVAKDGKESAADRAIKLAQAATYFHTPDKVAYADVLINNSRHTYAVRSKIFRLWLSGIYLEEYDKGLGGQALQDALLTLEAIAVHRGESREVYLRTAGYQSKIYLDLGSEDWSAIEIDSTGWRIISEPPVRFWRPETLLPLPMPENGGSIQELKDLLNVDDDSWVLTSTFLLFCFYPDQTYPVLVASAPRGSAKTTFAEIIKGLVDPGKAPLIQLVNDTHKLAIAATRRLLLVYDNVGYISPEQSDNLCRVSTGFGYSTRTLNTTDEETTFEFTRPQIITAIDALVTRDDLADRALHVGLKPIPENKRLPQSEVRARVEEARPRILGALLTALSKTLAAIPATRERVKEFPRMADYALFATAAESSLGLQPGSFKASFDQSRAESRQIVIEASPIAEAIISLVRKELVWKGTVTELLTKLEQYAEPAVIKSRTWPKASNSLSQKLTRLKPDLEALGVSLSDFREGRAGTRMVLVERAVNLSSASSADDFIKSKLSQSNAYSADDHADNTLTMMGLTDDVTQCSADDDMNADDTLTIQKDTIVSAETALQQQFKCLTDDADDKKSASSGQGEEKQDFSEYQDDI